MRAPTIMGPSDEEIEEARKVLEEGPCHAEWIGTSEGWVRVEGWRLPKGERGLQELFGLVSSTS